MTDFTPISILGWTGVEVCNDAFYFNSGDT